MTTIRIADGAALSLCRAQRARLRQCRNPTKKIVQSRRISVSGNGTAHPGKKIGIVDPSCDSKREFATGERLESGFSQSGDPGFESRLLQRRVMPQPCWTTTGGNVPWPFTSFSAGILQALGPC